MAVQIDSGTAYGMETGTFDRILVEVGPGTPGGELLRRYWQPIALSTDLTDLPQEVSVLGEELVLFRDGSGRPGLLHPRCCHRGTTLLYGKVESEGIRCCYHGWLFDVEGHCLDQPCEPDGGRKRNLARQPWYRVAERYGLIFAYLGPPDQQPPLPRYDVLEEIPDGLTLSATSRTLQTGGPEVMQCNWVQTYENIADPLHAHILHGMISGPQLGPGLTIPPRAITYEPTEQGMISILGEKEGEEDIRVVLEMIFPNVSVVPLQIFREDGRASSLGWHVPLDDIRTKIFTVGAVPPERVDFDSTQMPVFGGKAWHELDMEGHQRFPGDYEAQAGQGEVTLHSEEHLVSSDRGVLLFRKLYRKVLDGLRKNGSLKPRNELVVVQASRI
jgi:nitrite reductase/ring-hydroxylating ferredoxin subunit